MRKALLFSAFQLFFIHQLILSQSGWFWQNPLPQGNHLLNVSFVGKDIVYISGHGGTLLKSTDAGYNFYILETNTIENLNVNFINELTGFTPAWNGGILRTTTGGTSWEYFPVRPNSGTVQIQYVSGSIVFALCSSTINNRQSTNIYKSTDLGISWVLSLKPDTNTWVNGFHFVNQNIGYAAGSKWFPVRSKIYKTINGGFTWDSISSNVYRELITVYFTEPNTGFAGMSGRILKTTNGCLSWDTVYNNSGPSYIHFFNSLSGYGSDFGILVTTTNGGSSWISVSANGKAYLSNINDGIRISGSYPANILFKTTNSGTNWFNISKGPTKYLWDVTFINNNTGFASLDYGKILKTSNAGSSWYVIDLNIEPVWNSVDIIDFVNENTGYIGIGGGRIGKTTNSGINWAIFQTGNYDHNHGISFPSVDTGYAFTKHGSHLKTINGGVNWIDLGFPGADWYGHSCFINNNTGFAGGSTDGVDQKGLISITRNGGITWDSVLADSIYWFNDVGKADENTWFAVGYGDHGPAYSYNGYIYRSIDAGYNWNSTWFPNTISSIHFPTPLTGYAAASGNIIYKTINKGDSWFPTRCISAYPAIGIFFVNELTGYAVGAAGQIIKTTTGGGELIGIQPITNEIPKTYELYQNYPNPFNPATKIKFNIPHIGNGRDRSVKVVIYDILGREVSVLVNEQLTAGTYEVEWNANNFSSGVYFYRLEIDDGSTPLSTTKKMVLLR